jgi:hypothetical protein
MLGVRINIIIVAIKKCHMKKLMMLCLCVCCFYAVQAQQTPTQDSTLQQFVGKYKFPDGSVIPEVVVSIESGALSMSSSAGTSPLEKKEEDTYIIVAFQGTAKFNRDANKKIIGVSINAGGYVLEGTKSDGSLTGLTRAQMNNSLVFAH